MGVSDIVVSQSDLISAATKVQKTINDLGPGLAGYSLFDLICDQFPDWPAIKVKAAIGMLFNFEMIGYQVISTIPASTKRIPIKPFAP